MHSTVAFGVYQTSPRLTVHWSRRRMRGGGQPEQAQAPPEELRDDYPAHARQRAPPHRGMMLPGALARLTAMLVFLGDLYGQYLNLSLSPRYMLPWSGSLQHSLRILSLSSHTVAESFPCALSAARLYQRPPP